MELVHLSRATPQPTLGASLRAARLGRNITIEAVAAHTKLNPAFFRDLERDDLSKWPANQFYRESYLRGYAEAVGLDPAEVIEAFRREFVPAGTSGAAATPTPRRVTPVKIPIIIAITFVTLYSLARWTTAVESDPSAGVTASAAPPAPVELSTPSQNEVAMPEPAASPPAASATVDLDQIEGELMIISTPPGARVLVNGIGRGPTPVRVRFLPPGSYTVTFLLPGYSEAIRNTEISPKRLRVRVSATLELARLPQPEVPAESSAPAIRAADRAFLSAKTSRQYGRLKEGHQCQAPHPASIQGQSATTRFSRAFSSRNCFNSRASLGSMPPYDFFQR